MKNIQHIIAVASAKGGVGKSTTALNIALSLQKKNKKVGLLDADLYGPSLSLMVGLKETLKLQDNKMYPFKKFNIQVMSLAFLLKDDSPVVWRGPMVAGALMNMIENTIWGDLDYLVIDMPPGTGDIWITLGQKLNISGAVIVSTPQNVALLDTKKGIATLDKMNIPILGIVENMAMHKCNNCGHIEHIFGYGGGHKLADLYNKKLLASIPLDLSICVSSDSGKPVALFDNSNSEIYLNIAIQIIEELDKIDNSEPLIEME